MFYANNWSWLCKPSSDLHQFKVGTEIGFNRKMQLKWNFKHLYLENGRGDLPQTWNGGHIPGGHLYNKICSNLIRNHQTIYVWKSHFLSSYQYTCSVVRWLLGPHDTLPWILIKTSYWLLSTLLNSQYRIN